MVAVISSATMGSASGNPTWARWWDQAGRESKLQVGRNLSRFEIIKPCKNPYNIRKCKPKRDPPDASGERQDPAERSTRNHLALRTSHVRILGELESVPRHRGIGPGARTGHESHISMCRGLRGGSVAASAEERNRDMEVE